MNLEFLLNFVKKHSQVKFIRCLRDEFPFGLVCFADIRGTLGQRVVGFAVDSLVDLKAAGVTDVSGHRDHRLDI